MSLAEKGLILGKRSRPKKASTIYVDKGRIARHILPLLGSKRVRDLTPADINRFHSGLSIGTPKAPPIGVQSTQNHTCRRFPPAA